MYNIHRRDYKTLVNEIKEPKNEDNSSSQVKLKMSVLPNLICIFNAIPTKILGSILWIMPN